MLAIDGGPPVRGERVPLGDDPLIAHALIAAIAEHAGIRASLVLRPWVGVALQVPPTITAVAVAHALDAEQVTLGYVDFQGRPCVALPERQADVEQTAHSVAKVVHLLFEIHTPFINDQSEACPLPGDRDADVEDALNGLIDAVSGLGAALTALRVCSLDLTTVNLVSETLTVAQHIIQSAPFNRGEDHDPS
jgi:hypothetical protein